MRMTLLSGIFVVFGAMTAGEVLAKTEVQAPGNAEMLSPDTWQFSVSPYLWGAGIRGDVGLTEGGTAHIKSNFADIARELDVAFMGVLEARKGRQSFIADMMYVKSHTSTPLPGGALSTHSKTGYGFLGGGYTVLTGEDGELDVLGGGRIWYSRTDLDLQGGPADGAGVGASDTWVDVVVGGRGRYRLTEHAFLTGWSTVGGGQARLEWDVAGLLGYRFTNGLEVMAGYRAIGVDYHQGGFVYDVVQQGPMLGMSARF